MLKNAADYGVYLFVRLVIAGIAAIPLSVSMALVKSLAFAFAYVLPARRRLTASNLEHAFPGITKQEVQQTTYQMWVHLFTLMLEIAVINRKVHQTSWKRYVKLENVGDFVRCVLENRATVLVTAHFGNFEAAGFCLGLMGFPSYTLARTLDNPYLDRFFNTFRSSTGQYIVPKSKAPDQLPVIMERSATIAFLADQHAGRRGVWVPCLNRDTSAPKGVGVVALTNGLPTFVGCAERIDRQPLHFCIKILDWRDPQRNDPDTESVKAITLWYNLWFEQMITHDPTQYWWIHKKWRARETSV